MSPFSFAVRPLLQGACLGVLIGCASATWAETLKPATQYEADLKLCADEKNADARLQCRRDAKAVYDQALAAEKAQAAATKAAASRKTAAPPAAKAPCAACGKVVSVVESERDGEGSMIGTVAGGIGGALLGRQIGGGIGKDIATIAGAAGGAYAGRKIEEKVKAYKVWTVSVEYADQTLRDFEFREAPAFQVGDSVRNEGSTIVRQ